MSGPDDNGPDDKSSDENKDLFPGPDELLSLSVRLATNRNAEISDEEVVKALGPGLVKAFRYLLDCLHDRSRKTGEASCCHSVDIALRAADLGYPQDTRRICLLHDCVEDRSRDLADFSRLIADVRTQFGTEASIDTRVLTNRYKIMFDQLALPGNLPFDSSSMTKVRDAFVDSMGKLPSSCQSEFEHEFSRVLDHFPSTVDLSQGMDRARIDRRHSVLDEVKVQAYSLYLEDIADDARIRKGFDGTGFIETPLVVKALDVVDNLRTTEVANLITIDRILFKAEKFLDKTFFLHEYIHDHGFQVTFIMAYEYVKNHLINVLAERRELVSRLSDSRFAYLAGYLDQEISRLKDKYKVGALPVAELSRLRESIRECNGRIKN